MLGKDNHIPRPVRPSDVVVITISFILNIARTVEVFWEEIYELAVYHSNRKTKENAAWQSMAQDLESLEGETDGR